MARTRLERLAAASESPEPSNPEPRGGGRALAVILELEERSALVEVWFALRDGRACA